MEPISDVATLTTVHSAKGTEATICFVPGAKPGTYPHFRNFGDIESEEEDRRILYVAMTRSKDELFITKSQNKRSSKHSEGTAKTENSYFLADIPQNLILEKHINTSSNQLNNINSLKDTY